MQILLQILADRPSGPVLPVLFWVITLMAIIGLIAPLPEPYRGYSIRGGLIVALILITILGLYVLGSPTS